MHQADECYRLGTSRHPDIAWEWSEFLRAWHAAGDAPSSVSLRIEHALSEDEFVRLACLHGRPGAVAVLEREYIAPLRSAVRRICLTDDATDSALQELRDKLLLPPSPGLARFRPSSSFRAWLQVVATRTALDGVRRVGVRARREVELSEQLATMAAEPDECLVSEEQRAILRTALRAAVKRLPDEQRYALRMHVISGWNIAQIGRVLSVHRATVARWLVSAKDTLRVSLHDELGRLAAPFDEGASPLTHLPSRLDLSLSRVFASTGVLVGGA